LGNSSISPVSVDLRLPWRLRSRLPPPRLGRVVAIGVFILNTIPLLRLMGIQPNIEWLRWLEELLPTPPSEALEGFKAYLSLLLNAPFLIDFILGLVIGFKAA